MLACTRVGAVHSIVFGGFSASLAVREELDRKWLITADEGRRGGRAVALKANVDKAVATDACRGVEKVIVVRCTGGDVAMAQRCRYHDVCAD